MATKCQLLVFPSAVDPQVTLLQNVNEVLNAMSLYRHVVCMWDGLPLQQAASITLWGEILIYLSQLLSCTTRHDTTRRIASTLWMGTDDGHSSLQNVPFSPSSTKVQMSQIDVILLRPGWVYFFKVECVNTSKQRNFKMSNGLTNIFRIEKRLLNQLSSGLQDTAVFIFQGSSTKREVFQQLA